MQRERRFESTTRVGAAAGGLVFLVVALLLALGVIEAYDLITPGGKGPSAEVIAEDFGPEAVDPDKTGYDGQQTYAIARYFPDLDAAAEQTDSARYRMLRILPAIVAWPMPAGTPTVLALLAVNAFGFGCAVAGATRLGETYGVEQRYAVLSCIPLLFGLFGTTTGPIAWGLALLALERVTRHRHVEAIALFTAAALCRESVAVAAGSAALGLLIVDARANWQVFPLYAIPGLVAMGWFLILTELVGGRFVERVDPLAFLKLSASGAVVPALVFILGLLGAWVWRDQPVISIPALGYTTWMIAYTTDILDDSAVVRVNTLAIVIGLLGIGRAVGRRSNPEVRQTSTTTAEPSSTRVE